jgi:hypothetical protein
MIIVYDEQTTYPRIHYEPGDGDRMQYRLVLHVHVLCYGEGFDYYPFGDWKEIKKCMQESRRLRILQFKSEILNLNGHVTTT